VACGLVIRAVGIPRGSDRRVFLFADRTKVEMGPVFYVVFLRLIDVLYVIFATETPHQIKGLFIHGYFNLGIIA
jgi:hypothetical protein